MNGIDLTHPLSDSIPTYNLSCCFELTVKTDYQDCTKPNIFRIQEIKSLAGIGTHIDAPAHCFPGKETIDKIELKELIADCVVIKVDRLADENYVIMPSEIEQFEKENGTIKPNVFVIFYTGWDQYWANPEKYRNNLIFPSVHESTAKLLLERDIVGFGVDTLSADAKGEDFPVHRIILGAGKYLVENVANAKRLPATGAKVFVMPMKIKDGTEAPIRMIALV